MEWPLTLNDQAELDALVHDRIEREKAKTAEAIARAEKAESAIEEASAKAKKAEGRIAEMKAARELADAKTRVATELGVPADLIKDGTEDEMRAHAEALAAYATPPAAPVVTADTGGAAPVAPQSDAMDFVNKFRH